MKTYIIPFEKINLSQLQDVGGKNASLGEMFNHMHSVALL
jgi:phosphoenolpyruvate synthase/pyruvate phosphate dikinase